MFSVRKNTYALIGFLVLSLFVAACGTEASRLGNQKPKDAAKLPPTSSNKPKIVAFGDSLTAGFGLSEKESYPFLLQQRLNAEGYNYEVVNAGVSGDTSQGGLERIDWSLEQENVQILVLELGANDLLRGLSPAKMKKNLGEIIKKAQAKKVQVLLCGMLAPPTMGARYQQEFIKAFPDLADEYKVEFLPFILEGIALDKKLNQADGIHPNAEGAKILAENVYKGLKPLLRKN
ncbi:MAG TPA: arylesterase [Pyrinomonadaceae bacterium]|jgi:acyl-CoA thioesterase-1